MNVIQQIKRSAILLSMVGVVPLCASENVTKKMDAQRAENQNCAVNSGYNYMRYDRDVQIEVNGELPAGVIRFGNTFMKPKNMDPQLIHRQLTFIRK